MSNFFSVFYRSGNNLSIYRSPKQRFKINFPAPAIHNVRKPCFCGSHTGRAGPAALRQVSLDDKYTHDHDTAYMTCIEALVRLPILQHQRDSKRGLNTADFVSGYRGSPLGGVDQAT